MGYFSRKLIEAAHSKSFKRISWSWSWDCQFNKTGFLVSNIRVKAEKDVVQVRSEASYSKFLEYGTSKMLPRPFMFPASEKSKPKIAEVLFQKIKQSLEKFGK